MNEVKWGVTTTTIKKTTIHIPVDHAWHSHIANDSYLVSILKARLVSGTRGTAGRALHLVRGILLWSNCCRCQSDHRNRLNVRSTKSKPELVYLPSVSPWQPAWCTVWQENVEWCEWEQCRPASTTAGRRQEKKATRSSPPPTKCPLTNMLSVDSLLWNIYRQEFCKKHTLQPPPEGSQPLNHSLQSMDHAEILSRLLKHTEKNAFKQQSPVLLKHWTALLSN